MEKLGKIIGRLRLKHNGCQKQGGMESTANENEHAQNNGGLVPLVDVQLPKILRHHQPALSEQGWTTVTFPTAQDPLRTSLDALFQASREFFALPTEYKSTFLTKQGSENGWSRIDGEKEFITLRTLDQTPKELQAAAQSTWAEAGALLTAMLARIAESLGLPPEALTTYSTPCGTLSSERTATMLRLFRYEAHDAKVVAEPHCDLGLLSFVMGASPGLEVWNNHLGDFWSIEKSYQEPAGTLLAGRQLECLSNGRYRAGRHRVQAYGNESSQVPRSGDAMAGQEKYRYSIVFVLRAHSPVPIDSDALTTRITGSFNVPLKCTAGELFARTKKRHFNVNTSVAEREEQKRDLRNKNKTHEETSTSEGHQQTMTK